MIIVKYRERGTIEGVVKDKAEFDAWLTRHNYKRKNDGEKKEFEFEFELIEVKDLREVD